jgi:hypothetical protein
MARRKKEDDLEIQESERLLQGRKQYQKDIASFGDNLKVLLNHKLANAIKVQMILNNIVSNCPRDSSEAGNFLSKTGFVNLQKASDSSAKSIIEIATVVFQIESVSDYLEKNAEPEQLSLF